MKIINSVLKDDTLTITLDANTNISKVYLDSILNQSNMYSNEDDKHTHTISNIAIEDNEIIVDVSEYEETSFIVSVLTTSEDRDEILAINQQELYLAKVNLLNTYCSTCLDKHQKEVIVMCNFKSQLLEYALDNNLTEDSINHYIDLSRLLGMHSCHNCSKCTNGRICNKCCNGMCAL